MTSGVSQFQFMTSVSVTL